MADPTVIDSIFYVYEHWRPDKDVCFWVGKGNGDRAYRFRRNRHYNNVVAKLAALGMCVEVRLVCSAMIESEAFALERQRIAFWRSIGIELANYTDGGDGVSGYRHSEDARKKIREKRRSQKIVMTADRIEKIKVAQVGRTKGPNPEHSLRMTGRKHSPEHRAKISAGLKGRPVSEDTRAKLRSSNIGQIRSDSTKERLRVSHLGNRHSQQTRFKMSESQYRRWTKAKESV